MSRASVLFPILVTAMGAQCPGAHGAGSSTPPLTYELMIDGESFRIEADRQVKLQSRQKPGVTYDVALRIAIEQPVSLNTFRFEYDWPAQVHDDLRRPQRTVRIAHELGFNMLITDLGQPMDDDSQEKALKILRESTVKGFQEAGMEEITVDEFQSRKFAGSVGRGMMIRYRDAEELSHTCLVYLMTGPTFAGYCTVEYLDLRQVDVIPRVRKTLDSIRAIR